MKKILFLASLFLSTSVNAGLFTINYGLGAESHIKPLGSQKMLKLGWQGPLHPKIYYATDLGVYFDNKRGIWAVTGFVQFGPRIQPLDWFYVYNYFGPGFITKKDNLLGGYFQFGIDAGIGFIEPMTGTNIGLSFKHISSAGIFQPNQGRNYWLASVGWDL